MNGFEPRTTGIGSDRSTNYCPLLLYFYTSKVIMNGLSCLITRTKGLAAMLYIKV